MADSDNPFANAFSPDRGGLTGFIGGLAGVPTQSEAAGSATGQALSEIAALKDSGLSPQQSLIKYLQTPSGQDYFTHAGPNGLKSLTDGLVAMQNPAPQMNNIAPGAMLTATDPVTGQTRTAASNPQQFPHQVLGPQDQLVGGQGEVLATNPNQKAGEIPADVRSFQFYAQLNQTPPDELKRLAGLKLDPSSADKSTVASQTVDDMVKRGVLSQGLGDSIKAGTIKVLPVKNEFGSDTGSISVYDVANPQNGVQLINPKGGQATPSALKPLPGTNPDNGAGTGVLPPAATGNPQPSPTGKPAASATEGNPAFGSKSDMSLGAGPVSKTLAAASKISEAIDPRLIIEPGAKAEDRQTLLNTLRSNLQAIGTIGGGLSSNKGLIQGYVDTYLDNGFFSSPHSQVQKLIRLSEAADQNIAQETERTHDVAQPMDVRKQAAETVAAWQRVKASMPDYNTLIEQEKSIRAGTAGAPTVVEGAKAIAGAATKGLTEVKNQGTAITSDPDIVGRPKLDIDKITDPNELLAIDPRTLDRTSLIQYRRKLDTFKRGATVGK